MGTTCKKVFWAFREDCHKIEQKLGEVWQTRLWCRSQKGIPKPVDAVVRERRVDGGPARCHTRAKRQVQSWVEERMQVRVRVTGIWGKPTKEQRPVERPVARGGAPERVERQATGRKQPQPAKMPPNR